MFADGGLFPSGSTYASLPDRGSIAVVSNGAANCVSAQDPCDWAEIAPTVVREPVVLPASDLVLFVGFTHIAAWGLCGHAGIPTSSSMTTSRS